MIVVQTSEETVPFVDATRFSTDEHNNLCVFGGSKTDMLLAVFHAGHWENISVEVEADGDDQG